MEELKIIDVIDHKYKYGTQRQVVLNRRPQYAYEKKNGWLIAEDSGFFSFYYHDAPSKSWKAFAGRKFEIPMKDGSVIKANGQWWDGVPEGYRGLVISTGYGTPDRLAKCNVFTGAYADPVIIDEWLSKNEPSNNYHKYDARHADFGKQTIVSPWE